MEAAVIASVAATMGEGIEGAQAAQARQNALDIRLRQEQDAMRQQQINQTRKVNNVLATQNVMAATRGESLSSPSFSAVQMDTLNQFAQDQNADALNLNFQKEAIDQQKANAQAQGNLSFLSSGLSIAKMFGNWGVAKTGGNSLYAQRGSDSNWFNSDQAKSEFPKWWHSQTWNI